MLCFLWQYYEVTFSPFTMKKHNIMTIQTKTLDQTLKTLPNKVFKVEL